MSATGMPVSAEVVAEHPAAARVNVEAAKKAFAKLDMPANQAGRSEQVAHLQEMLTKIAAQLKQLESEVSREKIETSKVLSKAVSVTQQLSAVETSAQQADRDYYDSPSADYCTTGKGHF